MKKLLCFAALSAFVIAAGTPTNTSRAQDLPIALEASELLFGDVVALATAAVSGQQRFYIFHSDSFTVYDGKRSVLSKVETSGKFYPVDPVVDSEGNILLINSVTDEISVVSPAGQWLRSFGPEERPYSLARLSNGNILIASPAGGKLIHIYDTSGRKLRSFGDIKHFDLLNEAQNLFLNRGKVIVDSTDNVYFVFKYAPAPTVLKFTRRGRLITEFAMAGRAIDLQVEPARRYLKSKPKNEVGGFVITNSAAIDSSTGHLWICLNGSSRSGIVYEYSQKGKKLREYSFIRSVENTRPFALTYVNDIIVAGPSIYIVVDKGVIASTQARVAGDLVFTQEACPPAQSWPACSVNCPQGSCPASINCKSILQGQIAPGLTVTGSACNSLGPGQGTPPKPNGGCVATVTTCDTEGALVTHSTNQDCNPVKYKCSGFSCIVDCTGTFTTSNCNNTCTGTDEDGDGHAAEGNDCDDTDFDIHPGASINADCGGPQPEGSSDRNCNGIDDYLEVCTPILIDVVGNGFNLTDVSNGVQFDLSSDGIKERLAWTALGSDDSWLALDRNSDGAS